MNFLHRENERIYNYFWFTKVKWTFPSSLLIYWDGLIINWHILVLSNYHRYPLADICNAVVCTLLMTTWFTTRPYWSLYHENWTTFQIKYFSIVYTHTTETMHLPISKNACTNYFDGLLKYSKSQLEAIRPNTIEDCDDPRIPVQLSNTWHTVKVVKLNWCMKIFLLLRYVTESVIKKNFVFFKLTT